MLIDHWPLIGLKLTVEDLQLRWPTDSELAELASLAGAGIYAPGRSPFLTSWTEGTPEQVARNVIQRFWKRAGGWTEQEWQLDFGVFAGSQPVGMQSVAAADFVVKREVTTGSWLGAPFHGQGIGTKMRTAVLELAFTGLGAQAAASSAFSWNASSIAVSRKLGYRDDGFQRQAVKGKLEIDQRLRLDVADWRARYSVQTDGLERCLGLFGL